MGGVDVSILGQPKSLIMNAVGMLFQSNLFQVLITLFSGFSLYAISYWFVVCRTSSGQRERLDRVFNFLVRFVILYIVAVIIVSFIFDLGETYQYLTWYKRSFGIFGDGFPFILILFLIFGFYVYSNAIIAITLSVSLLVGSRIVLIASVICVLCFYIAKFVTRPTKTTLLFIIVPCFIYFGSLVVSNHFVSDDSKHQAAMVFSKLITMKKNHAGHAACETSEKCLKTQVASPIKQRLITSGAGLWMTMQGGFSGPAYPGSRKEFADFMMRYNPFGFNDKFNLSWREWYRAGAIQHPYLNIGSGYGPIGFAVCMFFYLYTSFVGYKNIRGGLDQTQFRSFTVFFIFLVLINQTQPWIQSGSLLLFVSGIAAAHIWIIEISNRLDKPTDA